MSPKKLGLIKLSEECGELQHIIGKKLVKDKTKIHKLEDEIADVIAASKIVIDRLKLDKNRIQQRVCDKLEKHYNDILIIDCETGLILS